MLGNEGIDELSQHVLNAIDSNNPDLTIEITPPRTPGKVIRLV